MGETLKPQPVQVGSEQQLSLANKFKGLLPEGQLQHLDQVVQTLGTVAGAAEARGLLDS